MEVRKIFAAVDYRTHPGEGAKKLFPD